MLRLAFTVLRQALEHKRESGEIGNSRAAEELRKNPYKHRNLPLENVIGAYKRGFYQAALGATDRLMEDGKPTPDYCFYRGETLLQMGKLKEAEPLLRECLAMEPEKTLAMQAQTSLGNLMLALGRCDEAIETFKLSLVIEPGRGLTQRALAEAHLVKGDVTEALNLARISFGKQPHVGQPSNRFVGEKLATLAWALAANEAPLEEVEPLVKDAVISAGNEVVSSTAQVHTHAGAAFATLGESAKSIHHLEKATDADAQGLWGRRAKAMIAAQ